MARKKYHKVNLPIIDREVEVLAESKKDLEGRTVKIDLTRDLKGKNFEIIFRLGEEGDARPHRLHVYKYFLRRMMRKSVDYVEDSFTVNCKDYKLRVKPFLIARRKISRKVKRGLRNKAKEEIKEYMGDKDFEEILSSLLSNEFQKDLSLVLKKIYPLTLCEIRDIKVESKGGEGKKEAEKKVKKKIKEESKR